MHGKYKIVFSYNGNLTIAMVIVFMKTRPGHSRHLNAFYTDVQVGRRAELCGGLDCNDHYAMV